MNYGPKANSLIRMQELGLPVPQFVVLGIDHYQDYLQTQILSDRVKKFLDENLSLEAHESWAVRSSSTKEDGESDSFAGLFESYLNLKTREEIETAIVQCWQSTQSERVLGYAKRKNIKPEDIEMAVVIQKFIEPDFAGVLFTAHPLNGSDQQMLIEVCRGRGERLVSGHITPDQIVISWSQPLQVISHQKNEDVEVPTSTLESLQKYAQTLQALNGCPQDIEFAVKGGQVFLVQSRTITKIQFAESSEEWTTADFRDGGVSSDVVSPVMWSLYDKIFSFSLPEYFRKIKLISPEKIKTVRWYRVHFARPYWNLKAVKEIMQQVPGYNEKNFDEDMSIPITYSGSGVTTPFSLSALVKVLPAVFALDAEFKNQLQRSQDLLSNFPQIESRYRHRDLSKLTDSELAEAFQKLIFEDYTYVEGEYFQTIYNASNAKMEFLTSLKKLQSVDKDLEYIRLISDLGDLEALAPAHELRKLAQKYAALSTHLKALLQDSPLLSLGDLKKLNSDLAQDLTVYNERFYYHSQRELDLRVPRWQEDLRFTVGTLQQIMETASARRPSPALQESVYDQELQRARRAFDQTLSRFLPGAWNGFLFKLRRVREFLKLREEIRCHSTKMYCFIRNFLIEIAKRRLPAHEQSLIFYADHQQILNLLKEARLSAAFIQKAQETRSYAHGFEKFKSPNEIGYRYNFSHSSNQSVLDISSALKGIGCSAGVVRARARVCDNIAEASHLEQGEILVTRFTDPGWTPLFSLASGVVCESGGLLSHAALISREYGIPSVLNVKNATTLIRNGQEIEIDGVRGLISIL